MSFTITQEFDVCVVGGGMVGAASACAFAQLGYSVAMLEPSLPEPFEAEQQPDLRVSALNRHSIDLLDQLHALDTVKGMRYRAYSKLSVWESELSKTSFSAVDIGEQELGIFAENKIIQLALVQSIEQHFSQNVQIVQGKARHIDTKNAVLSLDNNDNIRAKLIVGADGARSQVRSAAGIGQTAWDYKQRANLILVQMHESIEDETWQQFTPTGPLALLPMHDNFASLVWYAEPAQSNEIQEMDNKALKQAIIQAFPSRLGDFEICAKAGFGLTRMHVHNYWRDKSVLVGDAAHTINPLAGQGLNLGFKDVSTLVDALERYGLEDIHSALKAYEKQRKLHNAIMISTMDVLYAGFSNDVKGIKLMRNLALGLAEKAGPLKNMALKYAMGI